MTLQRNHRRSRGPARQQGCQTKHWKHRKSSSSTSAEHSGSNAEADGPPQAVPVGKATSRQCQKNLRQGKQRQQHADSCRTVAFAQRQQRRGHATAGHAGMQTNLRQDQARQFTGQLGEVSFVAS